MVYQAAQFLPRDASIYSAALKKEINQF